MEHEAYFLFVLYENPPYNKRIEGVTGRGHRFNVIRAVVQEPELYQPKPKRLNIDFDPSDKNSAFVVVCFFNSQAEGFPMSDVHKFAGIVETEEEANTLAKAMSDGGFRSLVEKREKFDRVEIFPVLVTKVL